MRILLTSNASHDPARGGSTRSNLVWLEHLASNGHDCRVVCSALESTGDKQSVRNGVTICSTEDLVRRRACLTDQIQTFQPDFVLVSSEDVSHVLLREAYSAAPERLIYLAHTPQFFPFGPESWNPDSAAARLLGSARAIVAIGSHMRHYIRESLGRDSTVIHPPIYGTPPFARFGSFEHGWILMINPCVVKGIGIFLELAQAFPQYRFAALKGWGATKADLLALASHSNITVLDSVGNIEEVLAKSRVLLVPSLWYEGFGLIAMEAMLRGLPVISSNSGGLAEAKQGTGFVVPVHPIERYKPSFDENHMPEAIEPPQDVEPWKRALEALLGSSEVYGRESETSREAALRFVGGLHAGQFEDMLRGLQQSGGVPVSTEVKNAALSPAKRALLARRLRERSSK